MAGSEALATHPTRPEERMGKFSLAMAWWSLCSAMFYIFVAASLAINFGAINAIIGMIITVGIYAAINFYLVKYANRTGLSTSLLSQLIFGKQGAVLATILLGLTAIYYAVFEGSVLAVTVTKVIPSISYFWACVIVVGFSAPLVIGSVQTFLSRFNAVLLPVYLCGLILLFVLAGVNYGFTGRWLEVGPAGVDLVHIWQCVASYIGIFVLMMVTVDFARLGRKEDANFHARYSFGAPFYLVTYFLNGLVGIFLVGTVQLETVTEVSVVDATLLVMGGAIGLIFIWATQTRINSTNFFVSTTNIQAVAESATQLRLPRWFYALIVSLFVLGLMASTDVFSGLLLALQYQSVFITAWVGVVLPYVIFDHRRPANVSEELNNAPNIHKVGIGAWFAGAISGFIVMQLPSAIAMLAPIFAFFVPAGLQFYFSRSGVGQSSAEASDLSRQ